MDDAGKIAITPRGEWNSKTEYEFLDAVFYNHTSWLAKQNNINQVPYEGSEYWQLMTTAAVDSVMIGATETTDGAKGIVPQPVAGDNKKVLKGDGTWADYSSGIRISQAEYDELTQEEKNEGIYFIYDAPSFDGVYVFQTIEQMEQAIEDELVPAGATIMVDEDTPYVINAEDIAYDNSESGLEANTMQTVIDEIVNDMLHIEYDSEDEALIIPDNMMSYDAENEEITFLI